MAVSNIKKNARGYGYAYTDLAAIHEQLEAEGKRYYQYIEPIDGEDYIYTVMFEDGNWQPPRRGCKVIETVVVGKDGKAKTNPAQSYGSGLTYARRYSLLMAAGYATTDDDAATLDGSVAKAKAAAGRIAAREAEEIAKAKAAELGVTDLNAWLVNKGKSKLEAMTSEELSGLVDWLDSKVAQKAEHGNE